MLTDLIPGPRLSHPEGVSKVYQRGGPPQKRIESLSANWSDPRSVSESIKIHIAQSPQSTPSPPAPPEPLSGWGTPAREGGGSGEGKSYQKRIRIRSALFCIKKMDKLSEAILDTILGMVALGDACQYALDALFDAV